MRGTPFERPDIWTRWYYKKNSMFELEALWNRVKGFLQIWLITDSHLNQTKELLPRTSMVSINWSITVLNTQKILLLEWSGKKIQGTGNVSVRNIQIFETICVYVKWTDRLRKWQLTVYVYGELLYTAYENISTPLFSKSLFTKQNQTLKCSMASIQYLLSIRSEMYEVKCHNCSNTQARWRRWHIFAW